MKQKTIYILLFRGVGGATQLPTAALRAALTVAGFEDVATYINSGNAIVRSALPREKVVAQVAEICRKKFGFEKAIFAVTLAEWKAVMENNPFPHAADVPKFLHAAWLAEAPKAADVKTLMAFAAPKEGLAVVGNVAYLHTPNGFGTSKLAEKFDKGIRVTNTARNWNTVCKLRDLAERVSDSSRKEKSAPSSRSR